MPIYPSSSSFTPDNVTLTTNANGITAVNYGYGLTTFNSKLAIGVNAASTNNGILTVISGANPTWTLVTSTTASASVAVYVHASSSFVFLDSTNSRASTQTYTNTGMSGNIGSIGITPKTNLQIIRAVVMATGSNTGSEGNYVIALYKGASSGTKTTKLASISNSIIPVPSGATSIYEANELYYEDTGNTPGTAVYYTLSFDTAATSGSYILPMFVVSDYPML